MTSARASTSTITVDIQRGALTSPASTFRVHTQPGTRTLLGTIQLINHTDRPVALSLDPVDAFTTRTLRSRYRAPGETIQPPASWLRLSSPRVQVPAEGSRVVTVAIDAPAAATPGDYVGAVSLRSLARPGATATLQGFVGVEALLPGPREVRLALTGATVKRTGASAVISLRASNDGNVLLKGVRGEVTITEGTRLLASAAIGPGTFNPHTSVEIPVVLTGAHAVSGTAYSIRAQLRYGQHGADLDTVVRTPARATAHATPRATPTPAARTSNRSRHVSLVLLAALLTLLLGTLVLQRRYRALLPRNAMLAMLERTLSAFPTQEQPISVVHIEVREPTKATNRRLATLLRRGLRKHDVIGDLWDRGLLIVLPETGRGAAAKLGEELHQLLSSAGAEDRIGAIETETAASKDELDQLVRWLRARGLGILGRGRTLGANLSQVIAETRPAESRVQPRGAAPIQVAPDAHQQDRRPVLEPGAMLGASPVELTHEHIEGLVASAAGEKADLRLRGALYGDSAQEERELCTDIAAMCNGRGGVVVLGVSSRDGLARACQEVALSEREEQRMRQIVASGTAPQPPFEIRAVSGRTAGSGFYVLVADASPARPHAVLGEQGLLYPRREGVRTHYLGEIEVADLYRDRFRGEREQIERLGAIAADTLGALEPAVAASGTQGAWLLASLVPNSPGLLPISSEGRDELDAWVRSEHVSHDPLDGFFAFAPTVGIAAARYTLAAALDAEHTDRACYLEAHADGATSAARPLQGDACARLSRAHADGLGEALQSALVRAALLTLRMIAGNAVRNAGCRGDAILEMRLLGGGPPLADGARDAVPERLIWARSRHTIPLASLAGEPRQLLLAARTMLAEIFQAFGVAEVAYITPGGELVLRCFEDPAFERWALEQGLASPVEALRA